MQKTEGTVVRYFKLGQDKRIPHGVLIQKTEGIGGYNEARKGDILLLDDIIFSMLDPSPLNFYPDILDRQILMIKGAVKEVFDLFLPGVTYKHCDMIDKENRRYEQYYIPALDILSTQEATEQGSHIFRRADVKDAHLIVSLEAIEAVLRRQPIGVSVEPADFEGSRYR